MRRYPPSEWLGGAAERGLPSSLARIGVFGLLLRRWAGGLTRERSARGAAYCGAGILTLVAIGVTGLFDPVVQTPVAGFIVPVLLGAMATVPAPPPAIRPARAARYAMLVGILVIGVVLVSARVREVWGTYLYASRPTHESLERAARVDPGSYTVMALTASLLVERGRCEAAAPYLVAARRRYPTAPHLDVLEERCRR